MIRKGLAIPGLWKTLLLALFFFSGGTALAYEEPAYVVIKSYADFELREYEPYVVAETYVTGEFSDVGSQAFRLLVARVGPAPDRAGEPQRDGGQTRRPHPAFDDYGVEFGYREPLSS